LQAKNKNALLKGKSPQAPVAQLDRALVFGTNGRDPQPSVSPKTCANRKKRLGLALGAFAAEIAPLDADLADLLTAWPGLLEPIKAGIVAMVKAAKKAR